MSLSGNLADVGLPDVLQFIHLGGRTGTLTLMSGDAAAEIAFHKGRIVNAWGPASKRLGELLVDAALITPATLNEALQVQKAEQPARRPLGQILVSMGAVTPEAMFANVQRQIERTIHELVPWNRGSFQFAVDDLHPIDEIALAPGEVIRHLNLDTQMVLLDALRLHDERRRDAAEGAPSSPEAQPRAVEELPRNQVSRVRLHVVSPDPQLAERLATALPEAQVERTALREAGAQEGGRGAPVILVDLRGGSMAPGAISTLRRVRPGAPVLAMVDGGVSLADVYHAGVIAAVPGDLRVFSACFRSLMQNRTGLGEPALRDYGAARLRRIMGDLRTGLASATISLTLMNMVSESVDRAVLLLVRREGLVAIGAFGTDSKGRALSETAHRLVLPVEENSAFDQSLKDGQLRALDFDEARLPAPFTALLGCPRTGQCAVFPVMGGQRVIALVYADNGQSDRAIEELDFLDLAVSQAGLAFENELLRRQGQQG